MSYNDNYYMRRIILFLGRRPHISTQDSAVFNEFGPDDTIVRAIKKAIDLGFIFELDGLLRLTPGGRILAGRLT